MSIYIGKGIMLAHRKKKKKKRIYTGNPPLPSLIYKKPKFFFFVQKTLLYISEYRKLPSWSTYSMVCCVAQ